MKTSDCLVKEYLLPSSATYFLGAIALVLVSGGASVFVPGLSYAWVLGGIGVLFLLAKHNQSLALYQKMYVAEHESVTREMLMAAAFSDRLTMETRIFWHNYLARFPSR
jgi:hypothetical protein